jgi:hypothetical protein
MAHNAMHGKSGPMRLHDDLSHLGDIKSLVALLSSNELYKDPKVYALWVGMFTSGLIYGPSKRAPTQRLESIVDVNYEAHARHEMISRLPYQGFRHGPTAAELAERAVGFRVIRKLVRKDRLNNLTEASFCFCVDVLLHRFAFVSICFCIVLLSHRFAFASFCFHIVLLSHRFAFASFCFYIVTFASFSFCNTGRGKYVSQTKKKRRWPCLSARRRSGVGHVSRQRRAS